MQAALILAGGGGSRLGGVDKAFLRLAGKPLLAHVLKKLYPQMTRMTQISGPPPIAISANGDPARFAPFALPVLPDGPYAGAGPLAGILSGLIWARSIGAFSLLTIPVDTPFFPDDLLARLNPAPAVAVYRTRQHHLCANWPVAALPTLESFLTTTPHPRIRDALSLLPTTQIPFSAATDPFLNINTPKDLAEAEKLSGASGSKTRHGER